MPSPGRPTPVATYRLQLTPTFGFGAVAERIDDLARLGVGHVYLSPIAEAVPGSLHGYDVVDHTAVRSEFGGDDGLEALLDRASGAGLGVIVDHVPNHASVTVPHLNRSWWTTLRDGRESSAAAWFDIDWPEADDRVIVPRLGATLDEMIDAGDVRIDVDPVDAERRALHLGGLVLPLADRTDHLPLSEVVDAQHYRLVHWRSDDRNVRRFFTIDDLVAVRVEVPEVARAVDTLPRRLVDHPAFAGVRVDHVDGLADPTSYLHGLRDTIGDRLLYVEKILGPDEALPSTWPVDGTTGYEHVRVAEHALLSADAETPLRALWERTGRPDDFDEVEDRARREVLAGGLAPDLARLVRAVIANTEADDDGVEDPSGDRSPLGPDDVEAAAIELTVALDRYRTYLPDDPASEDVLSVATERAIGVRPDLDSTIASIAAAIRNVPTVRVRWQQLTGPTMAKGAEDRAFYRHLPLASLSEVGGAPGRWAFPADEFHRRAAEVAERMPSTLVASTTHDTKRSATVRARSLALAARAADWATGQDEIGPSVADLGLDRADVGLARQTVVTAWPVDADRLHAYLVKATREAELRTSWTDPDDEYESALRTLAHRLVDEITSGSSRPGDGGPRIDPTGRPTLGEVDLAGWADWCTRHGSTIGLRLSTLHLVGVGVPDLYQGAPGELTSLVDPDNRRPPDWDAWSSLIDDAVTGDVVGAWASGDRDIALARLTHRLLDLRTRIPSAFGPRSVQRPLSADGPDANDVIAYARGSAARDDIVVVAERATLGSLTGHRGPSTTLDLPHGTWRDLLDDDRDAVPGGPTELAAIIRPGLGLAVLEARW